MNQVQDVDDWQAFLQSYWFSITDPVIWKLSLHSPLVKHSLCSLPDMKKSKTRKIDPLTSPFIFETDSGLSKTSRKNIKIDFVKNYIY